MPFAPGTKVVHKSDGKSRTMIAVLQVKTQYPPTDTHSTMANLGQINVGMYYCTWIEGAKKGEGYFYEAELELEP